MNPTLTNTTNQNSSWWDTVSGALSDITKFAQNASNIYTQVKAAEKGNFFVQSNGAPTSTAQTFTISPNMVYIALGGVFIVLLVIATRK